jgi:hypothetical protein
MGFLIDNHILVLMHMVESLLSLCIPRQMNLFLKNLIIHISAFMIEIDASRLLLLWDFEIGDI